MKVPCPPVDGYIPALPDVLCENSVTSRDKLVPIHLCRALPALSHSQTGSLEAERMWEGLRGDIAHARDEWNPTLWDCVWLEVPMMHDTSESCCQASIVKTYTDRFVDDDECQVRR